MTLNDFDYLLQLPGEERERDWLRVRLGTLSARENILLTAAALRKPPQNTVDAVNQLESLFCIGCTKTWAPMSSWASFI